MPIPERLDGYKKERTVPPETVRIVSKNDLAVEIDVVKINALLKNTTELRFKCSKS